MADPITLGLIIHAVPAALSAGTAYAKHRQQKQAAEEAESKARTERWRAERQNALAASKNLRAHFRRADEIFEVLTDIGVMLFRLEVANRAKAKAAWKEVDDVLSKKDTVIGIAFGAAKKNKTYGLSSVSTSASKARTIHLIAGLAFCAACFPMHIYWGYGCGKFNDGNWTSRMFKEGAFVGMDERIMTFKTSGLPEKVLLKQPIGVDKETPRLEPRPVEVVTDEIVSLLQMIDDTYNRDGYERPKDQRIAPILDWKVPEAFWMHPELYNNGNRHGVSTLRWQYDPGRLLFGWVNWNRADVPPGEAMLLTAPHVKALAKWLEGLRNIKFKVLRDDELDYSRITFPAPLRQRLIEITGNEHGIRGEVSCAVCDPKFYPAGISVPLDQQATPTTTQELPGAMRPIASLAEDSTEITSRNASPQVGSHPRSTAIPPDDAPPPYTQLSTLPVRRRPVPRTHVSAVQQATRPVLPPRSTSPQPPSTISSPNYPATSSTPPDDGPALIDVDNPIPPRLIRAKFTFPAGNPDELEVHTGDIVSVVNSGVESQPEGWPKAIWLSARGDGKVGLVPKEFVEEF